MESALRCSLRWLLERHGGGAPADRRAGRRQPGARRRDARRGRERRPGAAGRLRGRRGSTRSSWPPAGWPARSRTAPRRWSTSCCAGWPTTRAGCSPSSTSSPCGSTTRARPVELTGRVDRLEVDDRGPARRGRPEDRQDHRGHRRRRWPSTRSSAAYQAAVEAGAFAETATSRGGAALVQLGHDGQGGQGAGAGAAGRGRATRAGRTRWSGAPPTTMAASTFAAVANYALPGLPGADQLPGLRQGPAGRRAATAAARGAG